jgi:hypothetical protein
VLRSKSPDMVRQEIYGYLLTHYALSALICRAATEAGTDPDRVTFKRTVRIVRRRAVARHPPQRPGHDQAGQPAPARTRSMISLCWVAVVLRAVRSRVAER